VILAQPVLSARTGSILEAQYAGTEHGGVCPDADRQGGYGGKSEDRRFTKLSQRVFDVNQKTCNKFHVQISRPRYPVSVRLSNR